MAATKNLIFALDSSKGFGSTVAEVVGMTLSAHEERDFPGGEHKTRSLVEVLGKHAFIIHSLYREPGRTVNDKLCRLLFFIGSLKDAGASEVTVIAPYLCYSRKDKKTKPYDPITTNYVARLFEAMGADRFVTLDVHNVQAFENAFRIPTIHLEAKAAMASYFVTSIKNRETVVLSPDIGGVKRAMGFAEVLGNKLKKSISVAVMHKTRSEGVVGGTEQIFGNVHGKMVIILDDLISSGTTLLRAAKSCKKAGANKVYAAATHGVFSNGANTSLIDPAFDKIIITNSIPPLCLEQEIVEQKVNILDVAPLIGNLIGELMENS
ncbi:ribose-phosphate pyrophosphokinase [Flavobacteriaceae bacterium TP-CH-4]|uniref:ribose-phosphate diphosphokinase n=1 Tax=Pelagihabitans pacificus TaxID=2696054 RepID=A0A967E710_9FLAO|nr:ribose-phosphate diphosphokinase [Pelagihabitans pacificus]NHF59749.1 ribose-phosphate pyrophosphokinase [Pelagihabitans pacificus]